MRRQQCPNPMVSLFSFLIPAPHHDTSPIPNSASRDTRSPKKINDSALSRMRDYAWDCMHASNNPRQAIASLRLFYHPIPHSVPPVLFQLHLAFLASRHGLRATEIIETGDLQSVWESRKGGRVIVAFLGQISLFYTQGGRSWFLDY